MAERIQRKRTKGWKMPPNTICVSRPGPFGNPWVGISPRVAVAWFKKDLLHEMAVEGGPCCKEGISSGVSEHFWRMARRVPELRGKNLACWCPLDSPCHADILLEIAND